MGAASPTEFSTQSLTGTGKSGGVSWQASALSFFSRYVLKRHIARNGLSAKTARRVTRCLELLTSGFGGLATVRRKTIAGVSCDVIYPLNPAPVERVVLYLHGGGFFIHLPKSYKRFARRIAEAYGATVYLPNYRLAPEHRYPAAPDDCLAVYHGLLNDGCDPQRLCVMGDSAGGNLALVTLQRARDEKLPMPACAIVISPGADLTFSGDSYASNAKADPLIPMNALHQVVKQYVDPDHKEHPHASPMLGDFAGLPPLKILVGSTEVLLDASVGTAEMVRAAGGKVELQIWHEMPHVFPLFAFLPEGRMAMEQMSAFFNEHAAARKTSPN